MALNTQQRLDRLKVRHRGARILARPRGRRRSTGWTIDGTPIAIGGAWPSREGVAQIRRHRRSARALAARGDAPVRSISAAKAS